MKTILFLNEKGGVGKSLLTFNVAWELSKKHKVLIIDLDGQRANISYYLGIKKEESTKTMYDVLMQGVDIRACIQNVKDNLYCVPGTISVSNLTQTAKITTFKRILRDLSNDFEYCFIDVCPSPNYTQFLALSTTDYLIIPMLPDVASIESDIGIIESLEEVKETTNPELKVLGILFNRFEGRTNISKQIVDASNELAKQIDTKVFNSKIRECVSMRECVASHEGVTDYDSKSAIADDFKNLCKEIVKGCK